MKRIYAFSLLIFSLTVDHALAQSCLKLVYSDEFESATIDESKWSFEQQGPGWVNSELQNYTGNRTENARIENGSLILEARIDYYQGHKYSSARLHSNGKMSIHQGRMEFRAKLPGGRGTWPALWMMPNDIFRHATTCSAQTGWTQDCDAWPNSGEIDVMEYVGYDPGVIHGSAHTKNANFKSGGNFTSHINISNETDQFHTYAIEWRENTIEWFVDDQSYGLLNKPNDNWEDWPFDQPFYAIMNIAIGGSWGGAQGMDDAIFPVRMEVDYVRMYEFDTQGTQIPYQNATAVIPGKVEAENYDEGCNGVAYSDIDGSNVGGAYRSDGVDIENSPTTGITNVGWIDSDEWLEYSINVSKSDDYKVSLQTASETNGGIVTINVDGTPVITNLALPVTGSWATWETTTVDNVFISEGEHILQVYVNDGAFNLDYLDIQGVIASNLSSEQSDFGAKVFPTVSTSTITIKGNDSYHYEIYDMVGQRLLSGHFSTETKVSIQDLDSGTYQIVLHSGQNHEIHKVIKR